VSYHRGKEKSRYYCTLIDPKITTDLSIEWCGRDETDLSVLIKSRLVTATRSMSALAHFADSSQTSREVREVPLADIGPTTVIGHPAVMNLGWRVGSTLELEAAYSLRRNLV
jgi:hypothetical protein